MRKLVAALACRNGGTRLYGKPLQHLAPGITVLDQILATISALPEIDTAVLGISEGVENEVFVRLAEERGIPCIVGDQRDVLFRLIQCGRSAAATDVFRITSECPFLHYDCLTEAWQRHVARNNDITVTADLPEGTSFEIFTLESLERSHRNGTDEHRSEMCSRYAKTHSEEFRIDVLRPERELRRTDLRLTVDNPEDLVLCRAVYKALARGAPLIPLSEITAFLDAREDLRQLVAPYVAEGRPWPQTVTEAA